MHCSQIYNNTANHGRPLILLKTHVVLVRVACGSKQHTYVDTYVYTPTLVLRDLTQRTTKRTRSLRCQYQLCITINILPACVTAQSGIFVCMHAICTLGCWNRSIVTFACSTAEIDASLAFPRGHVTKFQ